MKPFSNIRLAYLDELDNDPEVQKAFGKAHDFIERHVDRSENWAMISGKLGGLNIVVDKTHTVFSNSNHNIWYSPSLDLVFLDEAILNELNNYDLDTVLNWLYKNWKGLKHEDRISIQGILDEKA